MINNQKRLYEFEQKFNPNVALEPPNWESIEVDVDEKIICIVQDPFEEFQIKHEEDEEDLKPTEFLQDFNMSTNQFDSNSEMFVKLEPEEQNVRPVVEIRNETVSKKKKPNIIVPNQSSSDSLQCPQCHKTFANQHTLKSHVS